MMGALEGKVVIITGSGRGIGRAHALCLASHGAAIVVNDAGTSPEGDGRENAPAEQVVEVIRARGGQAVANFDDVADWTAAGRMVEQAVETFGHLDALVTNAGNYRPGRLSEVSEEDWDSVVRVHLKGTAAPIHHAIRYWLSERAAGRPRAASIVTTTSRVGLMPNLPNAARPSYAAAKAGVAALTQLLSFDLFDDGIRVNAIAPSGYTRMAALSFPRGRALEADEYDENAPPDPFNPATNSPLVAYLVSDRSLHVTGHVFRSHYGRSIVRLIPWQSGPSAETEAHWDIDSVALAMETEIFGTRVSWPAESATKGEDHPFNSRVDSAAAVRQGAP